MSSIVLSSPRAATPSLAQDVPHRHVKAGEEAAARHAIAFSATGGEYFRIWVVNLLLTLVTLGLYYPWAKVRKLRYFYNNTTVAGHALDFHGNPRRMLRGMLLAGLFLVAYTQGGRVSPWAAVVGAFAMVAVWPALFRASMQFRLSNTSWRGLRFAFRGSTAGAYRTMGLPLALILLPSAWLGLVAQQSGQDVEAARMALAVMGGAFVIALLASPYFLWRLRRYQHAHYALGPLRTELRLRLWPVVAVFLQVLCMLLALFLVSALASYTAVTAATDRAEAARNAMVAMSVVGVLALPVYLFVGAFLRVRLQNLFWGKTGNRVLRFRSALRLWPYVLLQLKNWVLIVLTLGLYWPFAAVATTRMRLQAVSLHTITDVDELAVAAAESGDAAGDAAGDLFGLDVGY